MEVFCTTCNSELVDDDRECPWCKITTLRADNEAKDAEMKRMAVALKAFEEGRLFLSASLEPNECGEKHLWIKSKTAHRISRRYPTIEAAVDALMAEREE